MEVTLLDGSKITLNGGWPVDCVQRKQYIEAAIALVVKNANLDIKPTLIDYNSSDNIGYFACILTGAVNTQINISDRVFSEHGYFGEDFSDKPIPARILLRIAKIIFNECSAAKKLTLYDAIVASADNLPLDTAYITNINSCSNKIQDKIDILEDRVDLLEYTNSCLQKQVDDLIKTNANLEYSIGLLKTKLGI